MTIFGNGVQVVTSTTRPSSPLTGQIVYETDTQLYSTWTGSAWITLRGTPTGAAGGDLTGTYPDPTVSILSNVQRHNSNTFLSFRTSNTERMNIDTSGRMTLPYQPAFSGRRDTTGTAGSGTWVANIAEINRGNHYNTSTGVFTCPVPGAYFVGFQGIGAANAGYGYCYIYRNGANINMYTHYSVTTYDTNRWGNPNVNAVLNCAANDQITLVVTAMAGNAGIYQASHNTVSIFLLG